LTSHSRSAADDASKVEQAHAAIGGFLVRCSALEFRIGQFIARWFCSNEKQKFLSYVLHSMPFAQKRQVVEERLTAFHPDPEALRSVMEEAASVFERRDLVASGLLSRLRGGDYCIKSFSGARFLSEAGGRDILPIASLAEWSERATRLSDQLVGHGERLTDRAS
jgi:hypothetical protein